MVAGQSKCALMTSVTINFHERRFKTLEDQYWLLLDAAYQDWMNIPSILIGLIGVNQHFCQACHKA